MADDGLTPNTIQIGAPAGASSGGYAPGMADTFPTSLGDQFDAAQQQAFAHNPMEQVDRHYEYQNLDATHPKVDPAKLNKMFPGLPVPFSEPQSLESATLISSRHEENNQLQSIIDRGPMNGTLMSLGAGIGPMLYDPLNWMAMLALGPVAGEAVGAGLAATTGVELGTLGGAGVAGKVIQGGIHGAIGGLAWEPANALGAKADHEEYGLKEFAGNTAGNAVFGGVVAPLFGKIFGTAKNAASSAIESYKERTALGQIMAGKQVDLSLVDSGVQKELSGTFPKDGTPIAGTTGYTYEPIHGPDDLKGKSFYRVDGSDTLSDNPSVANGMAAGSGEAVPQKIHEVNLENTKLLNVDALLDPEVAQGLQPLLAQAVGSESGAKRILESMSAKEVLGLTPDKIDQIRTGHPDLFPQERVPHDYKYEPMDVTQPTDGKTFYHGTKSEMGSLSKADVAQFSSIKNLYGNGLYLTDNPEVAHSYAKTRGRGSDGKVLSAKLSDLNLVDLEKGLPRNVADIFNKTLEQFGNDKVGTKTKGTDAWQVLKDAMAEHGMYQSDAVELYQHLNSELAGAGYDGFRHEGGNQVTRNSLGKHNVVILFDEALGSEGKSPEKSLQDLNYEPKLQLSQSNPDALKELPTKLQELGFDGMLAKADPEGGNPHNVVQLFDHENPKAEIKATYQSDPRLVPETHTPEQLQEASDRYKSVETDANFDKKSHDEFQKIMNEPAPIEKASELDQRANDMVQQIKDSVDEGHYSEDAKSLLESLKSIDEGHMNDEMITKLAKNCIEAGG